MTQTLTQPYAVIRGETLIRVPHEEAILSVVHPPEGPNIYINAGKAVLARNLALLTAEETASLLHAAYHGPEEFRNQPEVKRVRDIMKKQYLWVPNRNLWTQKGVYVVQDPEAIGFSQPLDADTLEERLKGGKEIGSGVRFSSDETVRFALRGSYILGEQDGSLAENGFAIASYNIGGAQNLDEVAQAIGKPVWVYGVDVKKGQDPVQRVSGLGSYWGGRWLGVDGGSHGLDWDGYALGVLRTGEASALEK